MERLCNCSKPECGVCQLYNDPRYSGMMLRLPKSEARKKSYVRKGMNYLQALGKHYLTGGRIATEEVQKKRLELCVLCPELQSDKTCILCGCPVEEKVKFESSFCPHPEKKWLAVTRAKKSGCGGCPKK